VIGEYNNIRGFQIYLNLRGKSGQNWNIYIWNYSTKKYVLYGTYVGIEGWSLVWLMVPNDKVRECIPSDSNLWTIRLQFQADHGTLDVNYLCPMPLIYDSSIDGSLLNAFDKLKL